MVQDAYGVLQHWTAEGAAVCHAASQSTAVLAALSFWDYSLIAEVPGSEAYKATGRCFSVASGRISYTYALKGGTCSAWSCVYDSIMLAWAVLASGETDEVVAAAAVCHAGLQLDADEPWRKAPAERLMPSWQPRLSSSAMPSALACYLARPLRPSSDLSGDISSIVSLYVEMMCLLACPQTYVGLPCRAGSVHGHSMLILPVGNQHCRSPAAGRLSC